VKFLCWQQDDSVAASKAKEIRKTTNHVIKKLGKCDSQLLGNSEQMTALHRHMQHTHSQLNTMHYDGPNGNNKT